MKTFFATLFVSAAFLVAGGAAQAADATAPASKASAPISAKAKAKAAAERSKAAAKVKQININAATADELMTLPGIGEAEAKAVIAGRPYGSKGMLVSKNALSNDKALGIRELVFAGKPAKAGAKK